MGTENKQFLKEAQSILDPIGLDRAVVTAGIIAIKANPNTSKLTHMLQEVVNHSELMRFKNSRADIDAPLPEKPQMVHNKHRH